jgi:hypothetical protein
MPETKNIEKNVEILRSILGDEKDTNYETVLQTLDLLTAYYTTRQSQSLIHQDKIKTKVLMELHTLPNLKKVIDNIKVKVLPEERRLGYIVRFDLIIKSQFIIDNEMISQENFNMIGMSTHRAVLQLVRFLGEFSQEVDPNYDSPLEIDFVTPQTRLDFPVLVHPSCPIGFLMCHPHNYSWMLSNINPCEGSIYSQVRYKVK